MSDICRLQEANGVHVLCEKETCIYWRVADHLSLAPVNDGCAIQYFELLGDHGVEIAQWLLSVKERVEAQAEKDCVEDTAAGGSSGGAG